MKEMIISSIIVLILGYCINSHIESKYKKFKSRQLISFCPSVWTSLGILGTFCSIIWTLYFQKDYSDITKIISEICPAFATSVVGIICSLFKSISIKKQFAEEDAQEAKNYNKASKDDPEVVLVNLLKSNQKIEGELKNLNQTLNTNNTSIIKKFDALNVSLSEKGTIALKLENINDSLTEKGILATRIEGTNTKLNDINKLLSSQTSQIQLFLENLTDNIEKYYADVISSTQNTTQMLIEKHIIDYKKLLESYNELIATTSVDYINKYKATLDEYNKAFAAGSKKDIETYQTIMKNLHDTVLAEVKKEFKDEHTEFAKQCTQVAESCISKLDEALKKMQNAINQMQAKTDSVDDIVTKHTTSVQEKIKTESEQLDSISGNLNTLTEKLVTSITSLSDQMNGALNRIQKETSESVVNEIKSTSVTLVNHVNELRKSLLDNEKESTSRIYEEFNTNIVGSINKLKESFGSSSQEMKKLIDEFTKSGEGRKKILESLNTLMSNVKDEHRLMTQAVESSNKLLEDYQKIAKVFDDAVNSIKHLTYQIKSLTDDNKVEIIGGKKECPNCNTENSGEANFCTQCGTKI